MILEKWNDRKNTHIKNLNELNRQLVFAGIAIIWIFTKLDKGTIIIPDGLKTVLILFIFSISIDLIQYVYLAVTWTIFYRWQENKALPPNKDIRAPKILANLSHSLLVIKVLLNISAYIILLIKLSICFR